MMLGRSTPLAAAVVIALVGVLAAAQTQTQRPTRDTPAQPSQQAAAKGSISGRVIAADNGRPVRRARVSINAPDLQSGRAVATDDSGVFEFTDLPASRYTVTVSKTGYVPLSYGQRRPLLAGTPLQLLDGQQLRGIDFRLPRGSVISGHVYDETGDAMPGTMVRVMMYQYAQGNRQLVPSGNGQTDDRGEYRIWGLSPGDYYVSAQSRNINLNLGRGGPAGRAGPPGRAGGPDPPPIPSQVLDQLAARGLGPGITSDDEQLAYAPTYFPGVASPAEARPVTVGLSAEVLGVDFNILLVRTGHVRGRVMNSDGSPAIGGVVNLVSDVAGRGAAFGGYGGGINGDGSFDIASVPPGRYILRATDNGGRGGGRGGRGARGGNGTQTPAQFASQPIGVDGDTDGIFVTLGPGATIAGTLTIQATQTPVLPDVTQFRIVAPPTDPNANFGPVGSALINTDGTFTMDGVPAGTHWMRAQGGRGWTLKSVTVDGREMIDTPLDVRNGQRIAGVNLTFTDKQSEINGTLTDQRGTPMPEYTVLAFPTDSTLWRPQSRQIMTTRPDQNGKFQMRGLPAGDYYLAAVDPDKQGEWFEPDFLEQHRPGAMRVSLGEGDVKTQDFRVAVQ